MNIIKKQNGSVVINAIGKGYQSLQFSSGARICLTANDVFEVFEGSQKVFSFKFNEVNTTQIEPSAEVGTTTQAALLTLLQEDFFFDVSGRNGELVYHGELNDVPSGVGSQLLVNVPLESNCTYFMLILATARVGTERFSNMTPNYIRVYVSSMGVITLDNSGAASLFETFTINIAGGIDIATPNLFKYTFNCSTNVSTDVRATIKLIKHQF